MAAINALLLLIFPAQNQTSELMSLVLIMVDLKGLLKNGQRLLICGQIKINSYLSIGCCFLNCDLVSSQDPVLVGTAWENPRI